MNTPVITRARGVATVPADVHEANAAAVARLEAGGARRPGGELEMVAR